MRREYIEVSGIPQSIEQLDLEKTLLHVVDQMNGPVDRKTL